MGPASPGGPVATQKPEAAQRRFGCEPVPDMLAGCRGVSEIKRSQHLHRKVGSRILAVGIVLHVSVQAFEACIDFRRQAEKKHITLKRSEMK